MIVVQVSGYSGSGKTRLCARLAALAAARGHHVGYIKSHHGAVDRQGSDTAQLGAAGAARRWLLGLDGLLALGAPPDLRELLRQARADGCTLVLVEGFKTSPGVKCWLRRTPEDAPPPDVADVALDLRPGEAQALGDDALWARLPWRGA